MRVFEALPYAPLGIDMAQLELMGDVYEDARGQRSARSCIAAHNHIAV